MIADLSPAYAQEAKARLFHAQRRFLSSRRLVDHRHDVQRICKSRMSVHDHVALVFSVERGDVRCEVPVRVFMLRVHAQQLEQVSVVVRDVKSLADRVRQEKVTSCEW